MIRKVTIPSYYSPGLSIYLVWCIANISYNCFLCNFGAIRCCHTHFLSTMLRARLNLINSISVYVTSKNDEWCVNKSIVGAAAGSWFNFLRVTLKGKTAMQDYPFNMLLEEGTSNIQFWINVERENLRYIFFSFD